MHRISQFHYCLSLLLRPVRAELAVRSAAARGGADRGALAGGGVATLAVGAGAAVGVGGAGGGARACRGKGFLKHFQTYIPA